MHTEIRPFTEEMLPTAGNMLAQRHKRNRAEFPLLPARFEESQVAAKAVSTVWDKKFKYGYAAFKDEKMIAYLIGEHVIQPWGRCGYVYLPGYALAENENAALIQDLYARLGDDWIKNGVFSHGVYVSAADTDIIEALFNIGFGKERVDGLLDLRQLDIPNAENPAGIVIRKAGKGDNGLIGRLSHIIMNALANAPYWHPTIPDDYPELKEGWSELADDKDWTVWLALNNGEALGACGFYEEKESDTGLLVPPKTISFSIAATKPEARERGISSALVWHGLEQARKEGFEICYTDWISPNLLASRHWPRFGFKDVAYRLSKRVDPMIAWTRQNPG
jgi:GNAT superfamily N-acetyltransferase